eukprot:6195097-Pleurochrysis_carterae.AAC.1
MDCNINLQLKAQRLRAAVGRVVSRASKGMQSGCYAMRRAFILAVHSTHFAVHGHACFTAGPWSV